MGSFSRMHKIAIISLGAVGGGLAYYRLNTGENERKYGAQNSWTTNYTPSIKWDRNWDQSLIVTALRLHTGHIPMNKFVFMMGKVPSPNSDVCGVVKDVLHMLMECARNDSLAKVIGCRIQKCREPECVVKPVRFDKPEDQNRFNEELEKAKSKSVRHLFLIRHGQYNLDGSTDKERILTELGRTQASLTGQRLACLDIKWDLLVRSTMTRAQETATLIAKHLPSDIDVKDCQLIEEGAPVPPEPPVGHWRPEPKQFFQDGARIEAAFRRYFYRAPPEQTKDTYTLLVCHANVIRFFVCKALQFPPEGWLRISLNHGSITWISILPNGNVVLRSLSDSGHMDPKFITSRNKETRRDLTLTKSCKEN